MSQHPTEYAAPRPGTRGPTTLIVVGIATLVLAVAIGAFAVVSTVRAVPTGIVTLDGRPGDDVLAVIATPGTATAELEAGTEYGLLLVGWSGGPEARLEGAITVTTPAGEQRELTRSTQSFHVTGGNRTARAVATVRPTVSGAHGFDVPAADQSGTEVFVAEIPATGKLVAGIFGGVVGILLGVFLGIAGVGMLVAGIVWRVVRRRSTQAP